MVAGAGLAAQACAFGSPDPSGSNTSPLSKGEGKGTPTATPEESSFHGGLSHEHEFGSGGYGYSYAFNRHHAADRHHAIELAAGASETMEFTWHNAAGLAPPADLWIDSAGRSVLQVSSIDADPFVRSGLEVVQLVADAKYRVVFSRVEDSLEVKVLDDGDHVILRTETEAPAAEVVMPATSWRTAIVADHF